MVVLFFGCTVQQTHKTLTFFFDGVDKVIFFNSYLTDKDSLRKDAITRREAVLKKNRPDMCVHKPYQEKKCYECHTPDKRLLMPMPALCFKCHTNFNQTYAVVHGPVASGNCLNCHNQHSSKNPKLLIRQGQQICLFCHNSSLVFANKVHRDIEDAECTLCHNPHGGKSRFMIKDNISRDANRIALMDELTYRHLYGQIFCKVPRDVNNVTEIYILDGKGAIVATAHPDINGKFYVANLHPDQNYTFKFKNGMQDCKINIIDNTGTLLYVIEKNKKGTYVFDKTAYATAHEIINDSHLLQDTLITGYTINNEVKPNIDQSTTKPETETINHTTHTSDTVSYGKKLVVYTLLDSMAGNKDLHTGPYKRGNIIVSTIPDSITTEEALRPYRKADTINNNVIAGNVADSASYKGKIIVKNIPSGKSTEELMGDNKAIDTAAVKQITSNKTIYRDTTRNGLIIVNTIPNHVSTEEVLKNARAADTIGIKNITGDTIIPDATTKKSKIIVNMLADTIGNNPAKATNNSANANNYIVCGKTLPKISDQIFQYNSGTIVWVLNDAGKLLGEGKMNAKGNFLLNDALPYYHITLPQKSNKNSSQIVFLDDEMELIEIVNNKNADANNIHYRKTTKYTTNAYKLKGIIDDNTELVATINFDNTKTTISPAAYKELNNVVSYLLKNKDFKVFIMGYNDTNDSSISQTILAEDRAGAVIDYLIMKGINHTRITGNINKNNKQPASENSTNKSGELKLNNKNKRVEIYIKDN